MKICSNRVTTLIVLLSIVLLTGCSKTAESPKPPERWVSVGEYGSMKYSLDTHSIVKAQVEKATAATVDTVKRDIVSCWVKTEPIQGKEDGFAKEFGKDAAFVMGYIRIDRLNREWTPVMATIYAQDGQVLTDSKSAIIEFRPYHPNSMIEKVASKL